MIKIVNGNILNAKENIIGHQVNCIGVMGAGLAKQIRNKYPVVFKEYKKFVDSQSNKYNLLGAQQLVSISEQKYISNLFGQKGIGRFQQQSDYEALESSLTKLLYLAETSNLSVALPHGVGCGLAGGDWDIVYEIIDKVFQDYGVTLYKFK